MKFSKVIAFLLVLILIACGSISAQISTEKVALPSFLPPSQTLTLTTTLTKTSTSTATPTPTLTLPVLLTPNRNLIRDFAGIYIINEPSGSFCKLEIKNDSTFAIEFVFKLTGLGDNDDGAIAFADGRFFSSRQDTIIVKNLYIASLEVSFLCTGEKEDTCLTMITMNFQNMLCRIFART